MAVVVSKNPSLGVATQKVTPTQASGGLLNMQSATAATSWAAEVADVRSFLDENYSVPLSGGGYAQRSLSRRDQQLPWGRIGIDKWAERVIPLISGVDSASSYWQSVITAIRQACRDAVCFGNSTIIVDPDGGLRVSVPETAVATKTPFTESFVEDFGDVKTLAGGDGSLLVSRGPQGHFEDSGSMVFSIFYRADGAHPHGSSRLSPAIRSCIRAASRNKMRAEIAASFYAFPQRIFNGAWEELDRSVAEGLKSFTQGATTLAILPRGPQGEMLDIKDLPAADFSPFISMQKELATEVASGFGISFSDLGVTTDQAQSADAIYALKEGLSVAITAWEQEITAPLQAMIVRCAEIAGLDEVPVLSWQEPALPSKGSAADAAIKLVSAFPALKDSRAVLAWAGLPASVLDAATKELGLDGLDLASPLDDAEATVQAGGDGSEG